jgi:hypothetical protein
MRIGQRRIGSLGDVTMRTGAMVVKSESVLATFELVPVSLGILSEE